MMRSLDEVAIDCYAVVIWIDWYPYHAARFKGLSAAFNNRVVGLELVGGIGVHAGLKFRESFPEDLPVETLLPDEGWGTANKVFLAFFLWRKLSTYKPEVVLVPGYYTLPGIAAAMWARFNGRQSILMTESTAEDHVRVGWRESLKAFVIRKLFTSAVVGGRRHVEYLTRLGFPKQRIAEYYDVVENTFFEEGTRAIREGEPATRVAPIPRTPFFLFVGRLAEEKNVATLLSSWIAYREQGGAWPLVLIGDGPQGPALYWQALASGHSSDVFFAGLRSSHELLLFYGSAGCFVLPSMREPWGLVVNEAMASSLPILVSARCGCTDDLVHPGKNGFIFDPSDSLMLTTLLHRIAALSESERIQMGAASAEIIRPFTPNNFGFAIRAITDSERSRLSVFGAEGAGG